MKADIKMEEITKLDDIETEKQKFHPHKETFSINNIHTNKIAISNKVSFGKKGFKYFIGNKDAKKIWPLCIFLPKMTAHRKDFDETKFILFLIKDHELLEKSNEIWEKLKDSLKTNLIVNQYTIKISKIKSFNGKINTIFKQ